MSEQAFKRLDAFSRVLLWLWVLLALGVLAIGRLEAMSRLVDLWALVAFGGAFILSYIVRMFCGISDEAPIGPLRLWMFAGIAALLLCLDSSFIITPKIQQESAVIESERDQDALRKAQSYSHQMLGLRLLLALGLGYGVAFLPRRKGRE